MKQYTYLRIEKINSEVAIIVLNRPKAKNSLNRFLVKEISEAITELEQEREVSCVIFKGESDFFIAGADVREMIGANAAEAYTFSKEMKALHTQVITSSKPYIAAIQGYCLGGGFELALACDIRLAETNAKLGLPEINLGIIPGGGGIQRFVELVGSSLASQLIMTGELIDAVEAERLHIVNKVSEDVLSEAIQVAQLITEKSRIAITSIKKLIAQRKLSHFDLELEEEMLQFSLLFDHPDSLEGMSAFLEKRKPNFTKEILQYE